MPFLSNREMILLGTGTSHGVPVIGATAKFVNLQILEIIVREPGCVRTEQGVFLIDTSPELRNSVAA